MTNDAVYLDIVPDRRIVVAYAMTIDGAPLSASLATIEIEPSGAGSGLTYAGQAAFLDGKDEAKSREQGCAWLLGRLEEELRHGRPGRARP